MALVEIRDENSDDVVWGAEAIGNVIKKTPRQTFYLLGRGHLPARKIGSQWAASRKKLLACIVGDEAASS
jgi:hypothetical protein